MNKQINKVTIKDIAERAKVSLGTIDRVLHDRGEVKEETKERVLKIVEELGYTPNLLAKTLASKKTSHIAVIIPDPHEDSPYWEQPLIGIKKASDEIRDFNTVIDIYPFDVAYEDSFRKVAEKVLFAKPQGIIFNPVFKEASLEFIGQMEDQMIPYIYIDINLDAGNNIAFFGQDSKQSGYVAAKIMNYGLKGKCTILIVKLASKKTIPRHLNEREEGFRSYFGENHVPYEPDILSVEIDISKKNEPEETLDKISFSKKNIRGIFVPNSRVFKVANYLNSGNKQDILLIGYDLIKENQLFMEKGIIDFVICQKPEEQGYQGAMAMFNQIHKIRTETKVNFSPIDIIIKENLDYYKNYK